MLRDLLMKRVRPLVERLAEDLVTIAVKRIEAELDQLPEMFEIALSAYANDSTPATSSPWGPIAKALPVNHAADIEADRALARHAEERTKRKLSDDPLGLARGFAAMDRAVDSMLGPIAQRDTKPDNVSYAEKRGVTPDTYPPSRRARADRAAIRANGWKPITCQKCGFVGGNARGCGTAHESKKPDVSPALAALLTHVEPALAAPMTAIAPPRQLKPTPEAVSAAKARIARIAARAPIAPHRSKPKPDRDDNPNAEERWTAGEIAIESAQAEMHKHEGELPAPRSSFNVTPRTTGDIGYGGDLGDVEELNFG